MAAKKIVCLTQADFEILYATGSITKGSVTITYDQSDMYLTDEISSELINDGNSAKKFVSAAEKAAWNAKQDALVDSGANQNLKTFGGQSILGSGDIPLGNASQLYYSYNNGVLDFYTTNPNPNANS